MLTGLKFTDTNVGEFCKKNNSEMRIHQLFVHIMYQVSSQLIAAVSTGADQRTADKTRNSPSGQYQQLPDDEDGHLLYSEGTVLNNRCKNRVL